MKKQIIWESRHLTADTFSSKMMQSDEDDLESKFDDGYNEAQALPVKKLAMSPWDGGVVFDINDELSPLKQFVFWLAHTNFNISRQIADKILKIPGVEILRVLTRYRFIIAVGKAFNAADVKLAIQAELYGKDIVDIKSEVIQDSTIRTRVRGMANELSQLGTEWVILIFPNGSLDFIVQSEDFKDQYDSTKIQYYECVKNAKCVMIESG